VLAGDQTAVYKDWFLALLTHVQNIGLLLGSQLDLKVPIELLLLRPHLFLPLFLLRGLIFVLSDWCLQ